MTTATPDFAELLAEAAQAIGQEVRQAVRAAEFQRLWRKARASIRHHGDGYVRAPLLALREAFPEYASVISEYRLVDTDEPPIPNVAPVPVVQDQGGDVETEEEECPDHGDGTARCVNCDGYPYDRCSHEFECPDCGHEGEKCRSCDLDTEGCDHEWQCDECDQPVVLAGSVT